MNDGKSIDETEALPPLVEAIIGPTGDPGEPHGMDLRRRRLIRGAAGLAPVVLTLRSGGLAANSLCTPTVAYNVGLVDGPTGSGWIPYTTVGMTGGQKCATYIGDSTAGEGCGGAAGYIQKSGTYGVGTVVGPTGPQGVTDPKYYCDNNGNHITNKTVAILSSTSATSLAVS